MGTLKPQSNGQRTTAIRRLVHWPLMSGLSHLVQRERSGRATAPPSPLIVVPNVTAHPSTASVPTSYHSISMWHCKRICTIKGLTITSALHFVSTNGIGWKSRFRNELLRVEWNAKYYSRQSLI